MELIRNIAQEIGYTSVVDLTGSAAEHFDPKEYVQWNRESRVRADLCVAHAHFLTLDDEGVHETIRQLNCKWLLLAEVLGRKWRYDTVQAPYHRELEDYVDLMRHHDFVLHRHQKQPIERFRPLVDQPADFSLLLFRRCERNPLY